MQQRHRRDVAVHRRGLSTHNIIREDVPVVARTIDSRQLLDIPLPLPSIPVLTPLLNLLDPLISFKPRVKPADPPPAPSTVAPPAPTPTPTQTPPGDGNNPGTGTGTNPGTGTGDNGNGSNPGTGTGTGGNGNGNSPGTGTGTGTGTGGATPPDNGGGTTPGTGTTPGNGTNTGSNGSGTTPSTGTNGSGTTPGKGTTGDNDDGGGNAKPSTNNQIVNAGEQPGTDSEDVNSSSASSVIPVGSSTAVLSPSGVNAAISSTSPTGSPLPSDTTADNSAATSGGGGSSAAIGIGIAAALLALIGGLLLLFCLRRRRRRREKAALLDPYATQEKSMHEKTPSPMSSYLNVGRGPSSSNLARISAASSFASPIAVLQHEALFDEDPFSDNSSHEQHGNATVESSTENPFQDQNPFTQAQVYDHAFDAPTTAFPGFASPPPAAKLASGPSSGKYASLIRAGPPSPTVGEAWIDNRISVASSASVSTITPMSFSHAMTQQTPQQLETHAEDKHSSMQSNSSASHNPMGVFPIPIGDNGGTYTIRRPFLPTLSDELAVAVNENVVLVRAFDDGWAFISKMQAASNDAQTQMRGLVPIECFSVLDPRASSSSTVSRTSSLTH